MIEIKNISKIYGKNIALKNVSFDVKKGEILGIIGQSGSGKSTLAKILSNILKEDEGYILLDGKKKNEYSKKEYVSKLCLVMQEYNSSFNPKMNILEALSEPLNIHNINMSEEKLREKLKIVSLDYKKLSDKIKDLSGGEMQRLNILRSLILDPEILVFDEVISSLDIPLQFQIVDLIKKINKDYGKTIIFLTHNISFLKYLTKDILVLKDGIVVERGDVINNPCDDYVNKLVKNF